MKNLWWWQEIWRFTFSWNFVIPRYSYCFSSLGWLSHHVDWFAWDYITCSVWFCLACIHLHSSLSRLFWSTCKQWGPFQSEAVLVAHISDRKHGDWSRSAVEMALYCHCACRNAWDWLCWNCTVLTLSHSYRAGMGRYGHTASSFSWKTPKICN